MTSPPSRETGPTPEEQAEALVRGWWSEKNLKRGHSVLVQGIAKAFMDLSVEAKRSAHLADARAGCEYCRAGDEPEHFKGSLQWWWLHLKNAPVGKRPECERPEVWDALSLLGGK